jgi:hypothetical protein
MLDSSLAFWQAAHGLQHAKTRQSWHIELTMIQIQQSFYSLLLNLGIYNVHVITYDVY